jgi:hypothetical protein
MKFEVLGFEVHIRRVPTRRWEIQDSDERGYLAWYSGEPYMNRASAVTRARFRELPPGWTRVVRNVKTGERADFGTPPTAHDASHGRD